MVTIGHVAARAGVSRATVSRVVNGSTGVTESTRRRVEGAIAALDYRPDPRARELALGLRSTVALVVGGDHDLADVVARHLSESGLHPVALEATAQAPLTRAGVEALEAAGGVVAIGSIAERSVAASDVTPMVSTAPGAPTISRVLIDHTEALGAVAAHFAAEGRSRVAFLDDATWSNHEIADARSAFARSGVRLERPMQQRNLAVVLGGRRQPSALVAASPVIGLLAYQQARALGVLVPHDLEIVVIGTGDITRRLGVTAVVPQLEEAADAVVSVLRRHMAGSPSPGIEIRLASRLVAGVTTRRPQSSTAT